MSSILETWVSRTAENSWDEVTDAEAEALIKSQLIEKDPDAGKDWRQEEKGVTEDKIVGWYHRLNGHEFEQAPGDEFGEAWCAAVHGVIKSQAWLSDWTTSRQHSVRVLFCFFGSFSPHWRKLVGISMKDR